MLRQRRLRRGKRDSIDHIDSRRRIEELRPLDRVLVDAPQNALDADPYASGSLDLTEPGPQTHKLLTIQRIVVWDDGTVDDINVRTVQSNQWCEAVGAREGAEVPLPLDLVEMGLPEGLTGTVQSIQRGPQPATLAPSQLFASSLFIGERPAGADSRNSAAAQHQLPR